jgi:predicted ester cyclase
VRRVVEQACNQGDLAVLDALLAPAGGVDAARHLTLRQGLAAFREAVPDARWTIVEQIAAGDTVATRLAVRGTFSGPLVGLAPPGRLATLSGVAISRFAGGRLVDLWLQADLLGLLQQLGVMPPLALDKAVAVARVLHAGALLAGEPAPAPARAPAGRGPEQQ